VRVRELALAAGIDFEPTQHGYPHFYYIDEQPVRKDWTVLNLSGDRVRFFLHLALSSDVETLEFGHSQPTIVNLPKECVKCTLTCITAYEYRLTIPSDKAVLVAAWLRDLTDGYTIFDPEVEKKLPGLTEVEISNAEPVVMIEGGHIARCKPYYVGITDLHCEALPDFIWAEKETVLRRTQLYETHRKLGAKIIPFAGWEMPVWYSSVVDEHQAVRQAVGLFDVAHMGVYQAEGPDAAAFLDSVVANDATYLVEGESCYTHLLDPDANVIDDLLIYRRGKEKFLIVVNASNDDKDWAWLNAVKDGQVLIDRRRPGARAYGRNVILRNLRDPSAGPDMRVDIALQGPKARETLLALGCDKATYCCVRPLKRTRLCEVQMGGFDLIISRTGYTGEKFAYELFVHPDQVDALFNRLLEAGEKYGIKPCGLGARDSLRTEAGLPLYGHEMGGALNLGVAEAGFGAYVKTYKAWFIGRDAFIEREKKRKGALIRFTFNEKGVRMAHTGDPVVDKRGRLVGNVTSCAIDMEGYLTGQAYVDAKYAERGAGLYIYQGAKEVIRSLSDHPPFAGQCRPAFPET
jgi:glycine hydroxymethyltransferase